MRFEMRTSSCLLFAHGLIIIIMHDLDVSKALRQYALVRLGKNVFAMTLHRYSLKVTLEF